MVPDASSTASAVDGAGAEQGRGGALPGAGASGSKSTLRSLRCIRSGCVVYATNKSRFFMHAIPVQKN